tara:strand:+ start:3813 stop:4094 length:282 start_codon:yes stop_codon:yes gene_type:complete
MISFNVITTPVNSVNAHSLISIHNEILTVVRSSEIKNYEKSQPSSIENPVSDPNFNVMRNNNSVNSSAYIVLLVLFGLAALIPFLAKKLFDQS